MHLKCEQSAFLYTIGSYSRVIVRNLFAGVIIDVLSEQMSMFKADAAFTIHAAQAKPNLQMCGGSPIFLSLIVFIMLDCTESGYHGPPSPDNHRIAAGGGRQNELSRISFKHKKPSGEHR